jgi:phage FluMu protein Com
MITHHDGLVGIGTFLARTCPRCKGTGMVRQLMLDGVEGRKPDVRCPVCRRLRDLFNYTGEYDYTEE